MKILSDIVGSYHSRGQSERHPHPASPIPEGEGKREVASSRTGRESESCCSTVEDAALLTLSPPWERALGEGAWVLHRSRHPHPASPTKGEGKRNGSPTFSPPSLSPGGMRGAPSLSPLSRKARVRGGLGSPPFTSPPPDLPHPGGGGEEEWQPHLSPPLPWRDEGSAFLVTFIEEGEGEGAWVLHRLRHPHPVSPSTGRGRRRILPYEAAGEEEWRSLALFRGRERA